jgi:hypothetical protein
VPADGTGQRVARELSLQLYRVNVTVPVGAGAGARPACDRRRVGDGLAGDARFGG